MTAVPVTASTLLLQLTSWAVLVLALRGLEAGTGAVRVTWTEALAALLTGYVGLPRPALPGPALRVAATVALARADDPSGGVLLEVDAPCQVAASRQWSRSPGTGTAPAR